MSNRSAKKALGWGLLVLSATVVVEAARITRVIWQPSLDAGIMRVKRLAATALYGPVAVIVHEDPHGILVGPTELQDALEDRCSGLFTGHAWPVGGVGNDDDTIVFDTGMIAALRHMLVENC